LAGFSWEKPVPMNPISVAAQEIADLNSKINNLSDKVETQELIDIAE